MRVLSASTFSLVFIEITIFSILWLPIPTANIIWLISHIFISLLASYWFSKKWGQASLSIKIVWLILFTFLIFLPVIGSIIFLLFNKSEYLYQQKNPPKKEGKKNTEDLHYFSIPKYRYSSHFKKARNLLSNLDDNAYLRLLIASRHLPDREAYTLLKEALNSPFESARLMAFSLKGKIEERLQNKIQQKLLLLENTPQQHTADLHLSISKDYVHLCRIGILSESKENLLREALVHCMNSIRINHKSSNSFQQLSQILKLQGKYKQAHYIQMKAMSLRTIKLL